jgi:hypothetical protein
LKSDGSLLYEPAGGHQTSSLSTLKTKVKLSSFYLDVKPILTRPACFFNFLNRSSSLKAFKASTEGTVAGQDSTV